MALYPSLPYPSIQTLSHILNNLFQYPSNSFHALSVFLCLILTLKECQGRGVAQYPQGTQLVPYLLGVGDKECLQLIVPLRLSAGNPINVDALKIGVEANLERGGWSELKSGSRRWWGELMHVEWLWKGTYERVSEVSKLKSGMRFMWRKLRVSGGSCYEWCGCGRVDLWHEVQCWSGGKDEGGVGKLRVSWQEWKGGWSAVW